MRTHSCMPPLNNCLLQFLSVCSLINLFAYYICYRSPLSCYFCIYFEDWWHCKFYVLCDSIIHFAQVTLYTGVLFTTSNLLWPPALIKLGRRCDVLNLTMFFITNFILYTFYFVLCRLKKPKLELGVQLAVKKLTWMKVKSMVIDGMERNKISTWLPNFWALLFRHSWCILVTRCLRSYLTSFMV